MKLFDSQEQIDGNAPESNIYLVTISMKTGEVLYYTTIDTILTGGLVYVL